MSNLYTQEENTWAAMISNCRITDIQIGWAQDIFEEELGDDGIPTFAQIVAACKEQDPPYDLWFRDSTEGEQEFFDNAATELYGNWKIVGIYDDNDNSGMYAVAIETGEYTTNNVENGVIFSVRGTEPTTLEQKYLDLVNTDLNILNSDVTAQELVMYDFLDEEFAQLLEEKGYSNLATTGHSLGGYLSFSAAAHIMLMGGYAKHIFMQGTNIDGPGVTEENLEANKELYEQLDSFLSHYHYTYIGSLLTPICSNYISITTASNIEPYVKELPDELYNNLCNLFGQENADKINEIWSYIMGSMGKHALASLEFDSEGNFDINGNWHILNTIKEDDYAGVLELEGADKEEYLGIIMEYAAEYTLHLVYNLVYDENRTEYTETEYDLVAEITDKATDFVDNDNVLQIILGGVLKTITDYVYYAGIYLNSYEQVESDLKDTEELYSDLNTISTSFVQLLSDYAKMIGQPAGSISNWFAITDDIMQLREAIDSCDIITDSKTFIKDTFHMMGNFCNNFYGTGIAVIKEVMIFKGESIINATEAIVDYVESIDTLGQYLDAQKKMTEGWEEHCNKLNSLSADLADVSTAIGLDFQLYAESALEFTNALILNYTGDTSYDLDVALENMSEAQQRLLYNYHELYSDSVDIIKEIGISMRDYVTNAFEVAHAWGNHVTSNIIIEAGDALCDNLSKIDLDEIVSNWFIHIDDLFNDATDYIYGFSGGVQLRGNALSNHIYGSRGNNSIYGEGGNDILYGRTGNDALMGGDGDDILYGESGNDALYGDAGKDILVGGNGEDYLEGGAGADTYTLNLGDGIDMVYDYEYTLASQNDRIVFGKGIKSSDVIMERNGDDLIVRYSDSDCFTIKDAYRYYSGTGRYFVESMEFADGTVWNTEDIANRANIQIGTWEDDNQTGYGEAVGYHQSETFHMLGGNDTVHAGEGNDVIYGEEGSDRLYGENGNDTLIGGTGNDYAEGGAGADSYKFNLGDGVDTIYDYEYSLANQKDKIVFGAGIKSSDVVMERVSDNLIVRYSSNDYFIVKDAYRYYSGTGRYFVESMEFADGTVWNTEDIANRANVHIGDDSANTMVSYGEAVGYHQNELFYGGDGDDKVTAGEGHDVIYGEEGNDILYGENGNDLLIGGKGDDYMAGADGADRYGFALGNGTDTVYDYEYSLANQNDRIVFGAGIKTSDVIMERNGDNLVVKYSATDSFTVKDAYRYYSGTGRYFVESMEFADGTVWNTEEIANRANIQIGTEGDDVQNGYGEAVGYHQNETFHMLGGNDTVNAGEGNDTVYGEEGNDALYGQNGNDTLIGGTGNDYVDGSAGQDKYYFNIGDGTDTVYDYEYSLANQNDRIVFGAGIKTSDVVMERNGDNLVVRYSDNDYFTVKDAYRYYSGTGRYFVESMEFADGTVWNTEEIANRANIQVGTDDNDTQNGYGEAVGYHQSETFHMLGGNDTVNAGEGNDTIYGEEGNDTLYGQNGDDTLVGGTGNDYMDGGVGVDKYCFNIGDGTDTVYDYEYNLANQNDRIVFGAGIKTSDVVMERNGDNLVVRYSDNDYFTVKDAYRYYSGTGRYFVESMEFADGTVWNTEEIANRANIQIGTEGDDVQNGYGEAVGYHQSETFHMLGGNDTVNAGEGDDTIYGEEGNDTLYGQNGNDTLIGGVGNDYMDGSNGADKYCFNIGDGTDTVCDYEYNLANQNDRIVFGAGIKTSDVVMERNGDNLVVRYSDNDYFTIKDAYRYYSGTGRYFVESMEFADGTVWNTEDIANRANIQIGTEGDDVQNGYGEAVGYHQNETFHMLGGNDTVNAGDGDDTVYGEEGNDSLYGQNGNDTLIGGTGNDYMDGSNGVDKYCFNIGDGTDTVYDYEYNLANQNDRIVFGEGIKAEDVTMERNGDSLVVKYSATDSFTVKDAYRYYSGTGRYFVESMEFADGTVWNTEEIANRANIQIGTEGDDVQNGYGEAVGYHQGETFHMLGGNDTVNAGEGNDTIYGEEGNDTLYGQNGNDTLVGGAGNDYLSGGNGADSYLFNLGDGTDTVYDYEYNLANQNDRIVFGEGIKAEDVTMERNGDSLVVKYSATDSFTVKDAYRYYSGTGRYFVESMEFEDGTVWNTEEIANRANIQIGTEGDDVQNGYGEAVGYHQNETFHMLGGNDTVNAGEGDDAICGEEGNDSLYGQNGNDTLIGGTGNDYMDGSNGVDKYCFNIGDGTDTVYDYEYNLANQNDRIVFGEGIKAEDVTMERNGDSLVVKYSATDSFTVKDAYRYYSGTGRYFVESMEFADGTVWNTEEIANRANIQIGTEGNDVQNGYGEAVGYHQSETFHMLGGNDTVNAGEGNDTVYGEEGNDTLYGQNGNDTLVGGAGNDYLSGGNGADTYFIGADDGNDTINNYDSTATRQNDKIVFGENISVDDISIMRSGGDLLITNAKTEQTTVIAGAYNNEYNKLYNLEFYDEDTAVIDYASTTLNVTHVVNEEQAAEAGTEQAEGIIVSDEDVAKMTDLIVQEMSGTPVEGISQVVSTETAGISDSDSLLWTE